MSQEEITKIFGEIAMGRGRHGSFLCKFAEAVLAADPVNFEILRAASILIIEKFGLKKYLEPEVTA